jgi:hypothetical protein
VILIVLESEDLRAIGAFNPEYPDLSPFLSHLATNSRTFMHYDSPPYTSWSAGSLFAAQCGVPEVRGKNFQYRSIKVKETKNRTCLGDILGASGVATFAVWTYRAPAYISSILTKHGWTHKNYVRGKRSGDYQTAQYLNETVFRELEKLNGNGQPWALLWGLEGVHCDMPYLDSTLPNRVKRGADRVMRGFDQVDQSLELFFEAFRRSSLANTTDILVYGDRVHMRSPKWLIGAERRPLMMMPLHEKKLVTSPTTVYDVAPTLLDMLGVCYEPKFPWGRSLLSDPDGPPSYPSGSDYPIIANLFGG